MAFIADSLYFFLSSILSLILFAFFAFMVMSWLFMLNIVSPQNPTARQIYSLLSSFVEPILAPFRRFVPPIGGIDLAFFFAFILIVWLKNYALPYFLGGFA